MILVDTNLLLYAYQPRGVQHDRSRRWLESVLSGSQLVRFAWVTVWGFVRIATNPRVFERPLTVSEAEAIVSSWLAQPNAGILEPGATLYSTDRDFSRFPGLKCINPLAAAK